MRWHLIAPDGGIVRSVEAAHKAEARFRLAPIPARHYVLSGADYAAGQHKSVLPPSIQRVGRTDWFANCTTAEEFAAVHAKLSHHAVRGLALWQLNNPEKEQARRDKIAAYQRKRAEERRNRVATARRHENIRRGIERRKAKREGKTDVG